jgi:hypothetical protein
MTWGSNPMEMYMVVEVELHVFLASALYGGGLVLNFGYLFSWSISWLRYQVGESLDDVISRW